MPVNVPSTKRTSAASRRDSGQAHRQHWSTGAARSPGVCAVKPSWKEAPPDLHGVPAGLAPWQRRLMSFR